MTMIGPSNSIWAPAIFGRRGPLNPMNASTAPAAVYSTRRKINSAYSGNAFRVRDSGLALRSFGFNADGTIDTSSASGWGDGTNFTLDTLYDQSGNGRDLVFSSNRPLLVFPNAPSNYNDARVDFTTKSRTIVTASAFLDTGPDENFAFFAVFGTFGWANSSSSAAPRGDDAVYNSLPTPLISVGTGTTDTDGRILLYSAAGSITYPFGGVTNAENYGKTYLFGDIGVIDTGAPSLTRIRNIWFNCKSDGTFSAGGDKRQYWRDREQYRSTTRSAERLVVGSNPQNTVSHNGPLWELVVFNAAISDSEAQRIGLWQNQEFADVVSNPTWDRLTDKYYPIGLAPVAGDFVLSSAKIVPPAGITTDSGGERWEVSACFTRSPPWASTAKKVVYSGHYTLNDGTGVPEGDMSATMTIKAAAYKDDVFVANLTNEAGDEEATLAPGADLVMSFTHPSWMSDDYEIRTLYSFNGTRPANYRAGLAYGNNGSMTGTQEECEAAFLSGEMTNNQFGAFGSFFGPSAILSDGWDGRDVTLLVGDSGMFGYGNGRSYAVMGIEQGEEEQTYLNIGIPGTRPSNQDRLDAGYARRKDQFIRAMISANSGRLPFTNILSGHVNNDSAGTGETAGNTLIGKVRQYLRYLRNRFPAAKLGQTSPFPRVPNSDATWAWTNVSALTTLTPADSDRWYAEAWFGTGAEGLIDYYANTREAWTGAVDGTAWVDRPNVGTVQTSIAIGATSVSLDVAPIVGETLVLGAGNSSTIEVLGEVLSVTGTGPYTVTFEITATKAHASGQAARYQYTRDGTHPNNDPSSQAAADVIEAVKDLGWADA